MKKLWHHLLLHLPGLLAPLVHLKSNGPVDYSLDRFYPCGQDTCHHAREYANSHSGTAFLDRKSTRLNSSHSSISYAVFCLKKNHRVHPAPRVDITPPHLWLSRGGAQRG